MRPRDIPLGILEWLLDNRIIIGVGMMVTGAIGGVTYLILTWTPTTWEFNWPSMAPGTAWEVMVGWLIQIFSPPQVFVTLLLVGFLLVLTAAAETILTSESWGGGLQ
jgi:hypothetical protein